MSAILSAIFKGQDQLSEVFNSMANSGARAVEQWHQAGTVASKSFTEATNGANTVAKSMNLATASTDEWSNAIGNYDKSALEAVYTTEELVQMGFKTQESLTAAAKAVDETTDAFQKGIQEAENFKNATSELESELKELQQAYIGVAIQKGKNSEEAKSLKKEMSELSEVVKQNKQEWEELEKESGVAGDTTTSMISKMEQTLVAVGITKLLNNITTNVNEMANEFSNAEATIVRATGASGKELDNFRENMFNVYASSSSDLASVAEAITEVNTALGLQGQELEKVTSLFMDYANVNSTKVAKSVEEVSQLMNRFSIDVAHTEQVLDKFTLASQMSGVSVDTLSSQILKNQATLDSLNFDLETSIALFAMLEHNGINTQYVMNGFNQAIVTFAKEGRDAGEALKEVIDEIANLSNEADATALAVENFGVRAGPEMAVAIRKGKLEINEWVEALGYADGTLAETAASSTTLGEQWTQASNQMSMAFSSVLSPAIAGASGLLADLYGGIGGFLVSTPLITEALVVIGAGFMGLAGWIALCNLQMTIGKAVSKAFGTSLKVALLPMAKIVAIGAAITAGVLILTQLVQWLKKADDEFKSLTATSKIHYEEVQRLNFAHEQAVFIYGENSEEVQRLAGELEIARHAYEANIMTMEEFIAENERLLNTHQRTVDSFNESIATINQEEKSTMLLIAKLSELSTQTNLTVAEQQQMSAIINSLNNQLPNLALAYDEVTGSLNLSVEAIKEMAKAEAEQLRLEAQRTAYANALVQEVELVEQLALATDEVASAQQRVDEVGGFGFFGKSKQAKKDLAEFTAEQHKLEVALNENLQLQEDTVRAFEEYERAANEAALATVSYEGAVNQAVQSVASDLEILAESYDKAYESALQSVRGQFNLWDEASEVVAKSVGDINSNLEGQIEYWQSYNEKLAALGERSTEIEGLSDVMASFLDGSADSVNMVLGMYEATDDELIEMVANMQLLQEEQSNTSQSIAELATDFKESLEDIEESMHEAIENMNMEEEAALAARNTMTAYVNEILSMTEQVRSATEAVAMANIKALSGGLSFKVDNAYATGTMSAGPGIALVGEEGPELVNFRGGERVFTANETSRIFANAHTPVETKGMSVMQSFSSEQKINHSAKEEKRITLDITGKGEIDVSGVDEDTVWDFVSPKLKEEFMHIIRDEVFEEGDKSYDF